MIKALLAVITLSARHYALRRNPVSADKAFFLRPGADFFDCSHEFVSGYSRRLNASPRVAAHINRSVRSADSGGFNFYKYFSLSDLRCIHLAKSVILCSVCYYRFHFVPPALLINNHGIFLFLFPASRAAYKLQSALPLRVRLTLHNGAEAHFL